MRPRVVRGGRADEPTDARVAAVLEVLAGVPATEVARRRVVDPALLGRWVRAFTDAGTAEVTNSPEAADAQRRDRFLAAFAHEVRTPLTVAQGWASVLLDDELSPQRLATTVARLHTALGRLSERALDVELMAAASLGRLTLATRPITAGELLDGLDLPGLQPPGLQPPGLQPPGLQPPGLQPSGAGLPDAGPPGVGDASVGGPGPATVLTVDPVLFARVVRDLWAAAGQAPAPRARHLEVQTLGPWVELRVVRAADPVDPATLRALFEPFDLNDDATGVTMGLYLARALTVAHGGTLGVSQDDDGAVFWVRVPSRPAPARAPGPPSV